jgi:hypothetical protein
MKSEIIRWNFVPLKCKGLPDFVLPFSPVHKHRKFSAVLGALSEYSSMTIRPKACPFIEISKNTLGFLFISFCFSTFSGLSAFKVYSIFSSFDYFSVFSYSFFVISLLFSSFFVISLIFSSFFGTSCFFSTGLISYFISSSSFFYFFSFFGAAYSISFTF